MSVKREDLLAAATAGVLHFGEIDPLLIFLAQREVNDKKTALAKPRTVSVANAGLLYYLGGILAIGVATLCGLFLSTPAVWRIGLIAALWFTLLYALCSIGAAPRFDIRGGKAVIGMAAVLMIALMPLGVFALQRMIGL